MGKLHEDAQLLRRHSRRRRLRQLIAAGQAASMCSKKPPVSAVPPATKRSLEHDACHCSQGGLRRIQDKKL